MIPRSSPFELFHNFARYLIGCTVTYLQCCFILSPVVFIAVVTQSVKQLSVLPPIPRLLKISVVVGYAHDNCRTIQLPSWFSLLEANELVNSVTYFLVAIVGYSRGYEAAIEDSLEGENANVGLV